MPEYSASLDRSDPETVDESIIDKRKNKYSKRIGGAALVGLMATTGLVLAVRNSSDSKVSAKPAPSTTEKLGASSTTLPEKTRVLDQKTANMVANWEVAGPIPEKRQVRRAIRLIAEQEDQSFFNDLLKYHPSFIRVRLGLGIDPVYNEISISNSEAAGLDTNTGDKQRDIEYERLNKIWLAGSIVHEIYQLNAREDWKKSHPRQPVPDSIWRGGDVLGGPKGNDPNKMIGAENDATRRQLDFLNLASVNAPEQMIKYTESLIGSGYWNNSDTVVVGQP